MFSNGSGANINIVITPLSNSRFSYTEKDLNELANGLTSDINGYKDELSEQIRKEYEGYLSESEVESFVNEFLNSFEPHITGKEITTYTKNGYKCYRITADYSMGDVRYFTEQYYTVSNSNIYTVTITSNNQNDLQSTETKNIIDSFTIKDYKEPLPAEPGLLADSLAKGVSGGICGALFGLIWYLINKIKRKKEPIPTSDDETNNEPDIPEVTPLPPTDDDEPDNQDKVTVHILDCQGSPPNYFEAEGEISSLPIGINEFLHNGELYAYLEMTGGEMQLHYISYNEFEQMSSMLAIFRGQQEPSEGSGRFTPSTADKPRTKKRRDFKIDKFKLKIVGVCLAYLVVMAIQFCALTPYTVSEIYISSQNVPHTIVIERGFGAIYQI